MSFPLIRCKSNVDIKNIYRNLTHNNGMQKITVILKHVRSKYKIDMNSFWALVFVAKETNLNAIDIYMR
jgi:hypothetical protein